MHIFNIFNWLQMLFKLNISKVLILIVNHDIISLHVC